MDSFRLSTLNSIHSILNDETDIEIPGLQSWSETLNDTSMDIQKALENDQPEGAYSVWEEYTDVEVLRQGKNNELETFNKPDSSDSEPISSFVIPQRKHNKTEIYDKTIVAGTKKLFGESSKLKSRPEFPSELLAFCPDSTVDNTIEEIKVQTRKLFDNRAVVKRKNKFADFIASGSEDEPEIQPKVFGFRSKHDTPSRTVSTASKKFADLMASESEDELDIQPKVFGFGNEHDALSRRVSCASSLTTEIDMEDWQLGDVEQQSEVEEEDEEKSQEMDEANTSDEIEIDYTAETEEDSEDINEARFLQEDEDSEEDCNNSVGDAGNEIIDYTGTYRNEDENETSHEVSQSSQQTSFERFLQEIKNSKLEEKKKLQEEMKRSLASPPKNNFFIQFILERATKPAQSKPKTKTIKSMIPLGCLPEEEIEDMKYKPPKRFQPQDASWITKHLYKFLETKLESKYDYKARITAEKLVEMLYDFVNSLRRVEVAPTESVDALKREMARLRIVNTHIDFYEFIHEFMPKEVRAKVVPDIINRLPGPRHGVFSEILRGNRDD